jgi:transposase-like protein
MEHHHAKKDKVSVEEKLRIVEDYLVEKKVQREASQLVEGAKSSLQA